MVRTVRMNLVIPEWLKIAIKKESEKMGISMTSYILDAVKEKILKK